LITVIFALIRYFLLLIIVQHFAFVLFWYVFIRQNTLIISKICNINCPYICFICKFTYQRF